MWRERSARPHGRILSEREGEGKRVGVGRSAFGVRRSGFSGAVRTSVIQWRYLPSRFQQRNHRRCEVPMANADTPYADTPIRSAAIPRRPFPSCETSRNAQRVECRPVSWSIDRDATRAPTEDSGRPFRGPDVRRRAVQE
jgi:hypothetical protein